MIEAAFDELEPMVGTKGACHALGRSRASHYRHRRGPRSGPPGPWPTPPNALTPAEREAVLDVLHGERFVDRAPAQVWATLLDEGTYLGSESTMYRLLRTSGEVRERRATASHPPRTVPELPAPTGCDRAPLLGRMSRPDPRTNPACLGRLAWSTREQGIDDFKEEQNRRLQAASPETSSQPDI